MYQPKPDTGAVRFLNINGVLRPVVTFSLNKGLSLCDGRYIQQGDPTMRLHHFVANQVDGCPSTFCKAQQIGVHTAPSCFRLMPDLADRFPVHSVWGE